MSQDTLRMGLADLLVDKEGTLFVLAAYPHPDNDYGFNTWDLESLNSSDWHQPWNHEFWKKLVTPEPEEFNQEWKDVDLEYHNAWVLVRKDGKWSKEDLPHPCNLLRLLPHFGVCAIGGEAVLVRSDDGSWQVNEELGAYVDIVSIGDSLIATKPEGGRRPSSPIWTRDQPGHGKIKEADASWKKIQEPDVSWKKARLEKFDNLCATSQSVYLAGTGLTRLRDGERYEILAPSKNASVRVSKNPDLDGTALAVATTGQAWVLRAEGEEEEKVSIPAGFHVNLSVARFLGKNYLACGEEMTRGEGGVYETVNLPAPSVVDEQYSWSQCGYLAVRVSDDTLWVLGKHHIAYSRDGENWDLLDFS